MTVVPHARTDDATIGGIEIEFISDWFHLSIIIHNIYPIKEKSMRYCTNAVLHPMQYYTKCSTVAYSEFSTTPNAVVPKLFSSVDLAIHFNLFLKKKIWPVPKIEGMVPKHVAYCYWWKIQGIGYPSMTWSCVFQNQRRSFPRMMHHVCEIAFYLPLQVFC